MVLYKKIRQNPGVTDDDVVDADDRDAATEVQTKIHPVTKL